MQVPSDVVATRFATVERHGGNISAAARELGIAKSTLWDTIHKPLAHKEIPDPKVITRTTTLYDQDGRVRQQWVREQPEEVERRAMWEEWSRGLIDSMPPATLVPLSTHPKRADLLTVYPVGDHHTGMLSWAQETGADYDLDISEKLLNGAVRHLISSVTPSREALVAFLGDFMHYDTFEPMTATSKNLLDADGRFPKLVRATMRSMRNVIELAAQHHEIVNVIVEIGNHDLSGSIFLMEALYNIYENNPRINIDTSPKHFHYYRFGKCLIGTYHGHSVKSERLPLIMATDCAEDWGNTVHRMFLTGHVHHRSAQDYPGCTVESFRVLPPNDAWSSNKGFRSTRDMKALVLHSEHGECARYTVNPLMVQL